MIQKIVKTNCLKKPITIQSVPSLIIIMVMYAAPKEVIYTAPKEQDEAYILFGYESMAQVEKLGNKKLAHNCIPKHITVLDMHDSTPRFDAETIAGLEQLFINDVVPGMNFPTEPQLEHLFVRNYTGKIRPPDVSNFFIHKNGRKHMDTYVREHYLFSLYSPTLAQTASDDKYKTTAGPYQLCFYSTQMWAWKRTPRAQSVLAIEPKHSSEGTIQPLLTEERLHQLITASIKVFQGKCYDIATKIVTELEAASCAGTLRLQEDTYIFAVGHGELLAQKEGEADLIANLVVLLPPFNIKVTNNEIILTRKRANQTKF